MNTWSDEARERLAQGAKELARLELSLQSRLDVTLTTAACIMDVADRVSADPRLAMAEMGEEEFYIYVTRFAAITSVIGHLHHLRTVREQAELAADGVPPLDDGGE